MKKMMLFADKNVGGFVRDGIVNSKMFKDVDLWFKNEHDASFFLEILWNDCNQLCWEMRTPRTSCDNPFYGECLNTKGEIDDVSKCVFKRVDGFFRGVQI